MRSATPPASAVRSVRTWLPPDSWDLTSPGSLRSHVPVNLHAHSPRRLTHFWRKSRLECRQRRPIVTATGTGAVCSPAPADDKRQRVLDAAIVPTPTYDGLFMYREVEATPMAWTDALAW